MGAIQAFGPDDPQQGHLRMANFFKKASGYFTLIQAFRLAARQVDDTNRAARVIIGFAIVSAHNEPPPAAIVAVS
jgi:hypothetical protein